MNKHQPTNISASIRGRLLHRSRKMQRPFAEVLQYYAIERFLHRLACSPFREKFFLRGALLFIAWHAEKHRPTMDIDLLAKMENSKDNLEKIIRELCELQIQENDGIVFLANTVKGEEIQLKAEYAGVRLSFQALLSDAKIFMQIDVGFGDVISPEPALLAFPSLLEGFVPSEIKGYTRETLVAEKLHAMVRRQLDNTRMKDFFDIWFVSEQFIFSGSSLAKAIMATFKRRKTNIPEGILSLLEALRTNPEKNQQWQAFLKKNIFQYHVPQLFEILERIEHFLNPVVASLHKNSFFEGRWGPKGPWKE